MDLARLDEIKVTILYETKKWDKDKQRVMVDVFCEKCTHIRCSSITNAERQFKTTGKSLCRKCANTGTDHPGFGKKRSDEFKNKMSEIKKGTTVSLETREKMRKAMTGKVHTQESKNKMSLSQSGKKLSFEHKRKLSEIGKTKTGEQANRWVPPEERKTSLLLQIRSSLPYKKWRKECLERDSYTCQNELCKQSNVKLHVDHVIPFSFIIMKNNIKTKEESYCCAELWDINNGKTLCEKCHYISKSWHERVVEFFNKKE